MKNTIKQKKVRTLKDLQNHPLVESVVREEQSDFYYDWETRTTKASKYQYWVYLKIGYWFEKYQLALSCNEIISLQKY